MPFPSTSLVAPLFANLLRGHGMLLTLMGAGLVGLTAAFIALSRMKWGQSKPLVKCVLLAVYAHVLFLGFAYGTKMVFDTPTRGRGGDSFIRMNIFNGGEPAPSVAANDN